MKLLASIFFYFSALSLTCAGEVDVPNSFTAGTPARAAEVNQNFEALEAAIDDNASRLDTLEQPSAEQPSAQATPIEVLQQNALIGEEVDINGELTLISSMDFVRMDNDVAYVIEYPEVDGFDTVALHVQWVTEPISPKLAVRDITAYEFTLNGFPALLRQQYIQMQNCPPGSGLCITDLRQADYLTVQVGQETWLNFTFTQSSDTAGSLAERQAAMATSLDWLPYFDIRPVN